MSKFLGGTTIFLCSCLVALVLNTLGYFTFDGPIVPQKYAGPVSEVRDFSELYTHYGTEGEVFESSPIEAAFFIQDYPNAQNWIDTMEEDILVVFTDDPELNCGIKNSEAPAIFKSGGCYNNQYAKTLFVYWGSMTSESMKGFVLAHEYSHYLQWTYKEQVMRDGYALPESFEERWITALESDASCRVVSWGYGHHSAQNSSSPCDPGDVEWNEEWLVNEYERLLAESL